MNLEDLDMNSLSQMILNNPDMLKDLDEDSLCTMASKLNPYSKVVNAPIKQVLFSYTNFREDRVNALKALSLSRFLD